MYYIEVYVREGTWAKTWQKVIGENGVPYEFKTFLEASVKLEYILKNYYINMTGLLRIKEIE